MIAELFRYVHELSLESRRAAQDAVKYVTKDEPGWRQVETQRWIHATSTWHDNAVNVVPWCALSWRHERPDEHRELTIILRYWSRGPRFEPMFVVALARGATLRACPAPGVNLEEALRNRGWVQHALVAGDRVVRLAPKGTSSQAEYLAFAVSMDRLVDEAALQRDLVAPLRALLAGDLPAVVAALPEGDPARVVLAL